MFTVISKEELPVYFQKTNRLVYNAWFVKFRSLLSSPNRWKKCCDLLKAKTALHEKSCSVVRAYDIILIGRERLFYKMNQFSVWWTELHGITVLHREFYVVALNGECHGDLGYFYQQKTKTNGPSAFVKLPTQCTQTVDECL